MEMATDDKGEFLFAGLQQGDYIICPLDNLNKSVHLEPGDDKSIDFEIGSVLLHGQPE